MCSLHDAEGAGVVIRFKDGVNVLMFQSVEVVQQIIGTGNPNVDTPVRKRDGCPRRRADDLARHTDVDTNARNGQLGNRESRRNLTALEGAGIRRIGKPAPC